MVRGTTLSIALIILIAITGTGAFFVKRWILKRLKKKFMKSTFLTLKQRDFIKALVMATIAPVITIIIQTTQAGSLTFDWRAMLTTAIAASGGYLIKNLFTDDVKAAQQIVFEAQEEYRRETKKNASQPIRKGSTI
jgi:hypothetical protein